MFLFEAFVKLTCLAASAAMQPWKGDLLSEASDLGARAGPGVSKPHLFTQLRTVSVPWKEDDRTNVIAFSSQGKRDSS